MRFERVTCTLILACVAYWTIARWADWTAPEAGAVNAYELWNGAYWRAFTAIFLHDLSGYLHLVINMASLFFVGAVVALGCGRRVFLLALFFSAQAGLAASLLFNDPRVYRVGISGGIAGLVGVVLAVEWAVSSRIGEFLRRRNTLIVFALLVANAAVAVYWERSSGVQIDHAGHIGGFLFGLIGGLAYYARHPTSKPDRPVVRQRPLAATVVIALLGVLPVSYAAYPLWDRDFLLFRAERMFRASDFDAAESLYARLLDLDPDHVRARARLALLRDDPDYLDGLGEVTGIADAHPVLRAYLALATTRIKTDGDRARTLVERARGVQPGSPQLWSVFANGTAAMLRQLKPDDENEAGMRPLLTELAYVAYQETARWLRLTGRASDEWEARVQALVLLVQRKQWDVGHAIVVADTALGAARGFGAQLPMKARLRLETAIAGAANMLEQSARGLKSNDKDALRLLYGKLSRLYNRLAENTGKPEAKPVFRYGSALWWWFEVQGTERLDAQTDVYIRARFRAALMEARTYGDKRVADFAERWFKARGLPVPTGKLEEDEDRG